MLAGPRGRSAEAAACAMLMTVLGLSSSYFLRHLVDNVLVRHEARLLNALGIGMLLVAVFRMLFGMCRHYLLAFVARRIDLALMSRYSRHLLGLPMQFFDMRRVGEIFSRLQDTAKVREAISGTTTSAIVDGTLVLVFLAILWYQDLPLALAATAFVPLLVLSIVAHHPAAKRRSREAMERASRLSAQVVEDVSAVETIKAFGVERDRAEQSEDRLVSFTQSTFSLQKLGLTMNGAATLVTSIAGLAVLWYGGHRVMAGKLSIGDLVFFNSLLAYLLEPLGRLASLNLQLQDALVAIDRLYQVLDVAPEQSDGKSRVAFHGVRKAIDLRDVSFSYGCRGNVLEHLDLRIPAGAKVAIVGESGSGKSTLLKLLLGYYAPTEGQVLVDDIDLRDMELASLRRGIGVVSQEPFIFNGTLRENIAIGRPDASLDEVIEATESAGLSQFVASLPQRYETIIGERGANLSGGQRQRLAIARALLLQPNILIFDEATSHLDVATEQAIQATLREKLIGKTVVLVAHRLSTIRDADCIFVLRQGRVAESGTHQELLGLGGYYAELCRLQTEESTAPGQSKGGERSHRIFNGSARVALS
jgi:ATP-binding cassette subfamily B protein